MKLSPKEGVDMRRCANKDTGPQKGWIGGGPTSIEEENKQGYENLSRHILESLRKTRGKHLLEKCFKNLEKKPENIGTISTSRELGLL